MKRGNYYEYLITIENNVKSSANPTVSITKRKPNADESNMKSKLSNLSNGISAQMIIGSTQKLMRSVQNEKVQSFTSGVAKTAKYTFLGARALSGDVTAILNIAIDVVCELISSVQQTAMQVAAEKNSVDEARYSAGVLSLEGVSVSKSWWSGRYEYER